MSAVTQLANEESGIQSKAAQRPHQCSGHLFPALLPSAAAMDGSLGWALTVGALPRKHKRAVHLGKKENIFYCGILFLRKQFRFRLFSEASQIDSLSPDGLLEELRH